MPTSTSQRLHQIDVQLESEFGRDYGQLTVKHTQDRQVQPAACAAGTDVFKFPACPVLKSDLLLVYQGLSEALAHLQALPADAPPTDEEARLLAILLADIRSQDHLTQIVGVQRDATPSL
jgi:hypothetical protein